MSDENDMLGNIEATMAEAFDRAQAEDTAPVETVEQEAPEQESQPRDERGKFAPKAKEQATEQTDAQSAETAAPAKPKRPRPSMLPQDLDWDGLPETWQEYHERREREIAKGFEQRAQKIKQYEPIDQVLEPRRARLRATYGSEAAALNHLFTLAEYAEQDPQGFINQFAQARGLPGVQLSQAPQGVQTQQGRPFDPEAAVREQIERIEAERAFAEFQAQHAEDQFLNEQRYTDSGDVQYPFRALMAALLQAGAATSLADAYEMAKYARPDIRQQLTAKQLADERAKWEEEAKKRAQDAQRANALNVRGSPAPRLPAKGKTIEETMAAVYDSRSAA